MSKRQKVSKSGSKQLFSATSSRTHKKNLQAVPMRGGYRI